MPFVLRWVGDMTSSPNATADLMTRVIRLNDRLIVSRVRMRGQWLVQIEKPEGHEYFRIGENEYELVSAFDGEKSVATVCGDVASRLGETAPSTPQAIAIVRWMIENGLAAFSEAGRMSADVNDFLNGSTARFSSAKKTGWWKRLNPFWMTVPLMKGLSTRAMLLDRLGGLFSSVAFVVWIAVLSVAVLTLCVTWRSFLQADINVFDGSQWIALAGIWFALKLVHELAHAVACRRFGGNVREAGVVFVLFAPLAYVDVTDAWRIPSRRQRMVVSLAGMYAELFIASIAVVGAAVVESPEVLLLLQQTVMIAGISTVLFNANPLMRFDGYHILADAVDVPNLDSISRKMLTDQVKRLFTGRLPTGAVLEGWRWWFAMGFAMAAWGWRTMIAVSLLIAAAWLGKGSGIIIAVVGALTWYGRPLWRLVGWTRKTQSESPHQLLRAGLVASALGVIGYAGMNHVEIPTSLSAPALVRFPVDSLVRCRADGFLDQLLVRDGQTVTSGQPLARLVNSELAFMVEDLQLQIRISEQRVRMALNAHDVAAEQIELANLSSLKKQLSHKQDEASGLTLLAHRDGVVVARDLTQEQGTFFHRGDALMKIVQSDRKEAVAMVGQRDIDLVRLSGDQVNFAVAGQARFCGTVQRMEPRATDRLPAEALAAPSGGPLAVQAADPDDPSSEERWQLLEPRFRVVADLDADAAVLIPDGTVVQARFGTRRDPLGTRIRDVVRALWYQAESISIR